VFKRICPQSIKINSYCNLKLHLISNHNFLTPKCVLYCNVRWVHTEEWVKDVLLYVDLTGLSAQSFILVWFIFYSDRIFWTQFVCTDGYFRCNVYQYPKSIQEVQSPHDIWCGAQCTWNTVCDNTNKFFLFQNLQTSRSHLKKQASFVAVRHLFEVHIVAKRVNRTISVVIYEFFYFLWSKIQRSPAFLFFLCWFVSQSSNFSVTI
jgi:hypothetical protein